MFNKFILILCVTVLANFTAKAQVLITNDTIHHEAFAGVDPSDYIDIPTYTKIVNAKNIADTIVWTRIENTLQSAEWTSAVCDINLCHGTGVSTEKFIIGANDTGDLSFHFYPTNICGKGKMVIRFSRFSNPTEYTDIVATVKAWCPTSLKSLKTNAIAVYPNPSNGIFALNSEIVTQGILSIYNVEGKLISKLPYSSGQEVNLSALNKGLYMLAFSDEKNTVYTKITIE